MYDSIVIGGGPAGLTTALYLLRAGKSVLVLEKEAPGGQIAKSPRLENFPSIKAISGMDFSSELFDQVTDLGADFELENGVAIEKEGDAFKGCLQLKEVELPVTIKELGGSAFQECKTLAKVNILNPAPPKVSGDTFKGSAPIILVPKGSMQVYAIDKKWGKQKGVQENK